MSAHTNSITFEVTDSGDVIIAESGDVISPDDLVIMVKDAREKHAELYPVWHTVYRFDVFPSCAKWSKAQRMHDAVRK